MMLRLLIAIAVIGSIGPVAAAKPAVWVTSSETGVRLGEQVTFTAHVSEQIIDSVDKVTFSYQGTSETDVDTSYPWQVTKTMDWATIENLTVTAIFDFHVIPDKFAQVDVDVVDISLTGAQQPDRGTLVTYTAQTAPTGISVSSWDWDFDGELVDNETTDTEDSDDESTWPGTMITSGTLLVEATLLGVDCTKEVEISVQARSWSTPTDCAQDNEPLWGAPPFGYNEPLGQIHDKNTDVFHIIVPQSSTGDWSDGVTLSGVSSGPNEGLWYVAGETLEIDQETVINRYIKAGGPPPVPWATNFFDYNNAGCISGDMADFVTAVEHHEYRGTPPAAQSLEGHFGRMEHALENGPGDPGDAIEDLMDTTEAALMQEVNITIDFIDGYIGGFSGHGSWSQAGPNWGGEGSLGSGEHTRYNVLDDRYYYFCTFGPDMF